MDTIISNHPLAAVQLIPIYSYLNILSDFLFTENYLTKEDQSKQIPIVNAIYKYLEDYRNNDEMKVKLIRKLLEGSDLYGENDSESLDTIFSNGMLDYIISSLVFSKYGNIFGFLADTIRRTKSLEYDHVLKVIKERLENSTFENEYGASSTLSTLAVNRICNDTILLLFPKPKTNINILSLDYMFAQAGAIYLRHGRLNATYGMEFQKFLTPKYDEESFDQCLVVGHVIKNLLDHKKIDTLTYRAFALPVLLHYISTQNISKNQTITNIIFEPDGWKAAYDKFIDYVNDAFNKIENQLSEDYIYKLHKKFSNFQSTAVMANLVFNLKCLFWPKEIRKANIQVYMDYADHYECKIGDVLPNINEWYEKQIHDLAEIYGKHDLQMTESQFNESSIKELRDVIINLIVPNDKVFANVNNGQKLSSDLLKLYYPDNETDYYALLRKDNNVTLIKESDNPEFFKQIFGLQLEPLKRLGDRITVKFGHEELNKFTQNLTNYKKERLKTYLHYSDEDPKKHQWWKEFGLPFVLFYPCLSNTKDYQVNDEYKLCERDDLKFLNKFHGDVSSFIINAETHSLLSSVGANIKTVFIKHIIDELMDTYIIEDKNYYDIYVKLSLHIEEPNFEIISVTTEGIKLVNTVIQNLKDKVDYSGFKFVERSMNNILLLHLKHSRYLGEIGRKHRQSLFIDTINDNTGFGYKYIHSPTPHDIAQLRTDYDFKEKFFIFKANYSSVNTEMYFQIDNDTLDVKPDYFLYEINNQLRRKSTNIIFSGISIHQDNNDKCNDGIHLETKYINVCVRHQKFIDKVTTEHSTIERLKTDALIAGEILTKEEIGAELRKYVIPDDVTSLSYFVQNWLNNDFKESDWSKNNKINNSSLLNKLRYEVSLDETFVTTYDVQSRIDSIYTYRERCKIEETTPLANIVASYNNQKAHFSVTFEDYYAILNFATSGETRITGDTNEAKQMKLALYKLAIRQSDDQDEEFDSQLYRVECRPLAYVNRELQVGNEIVLQKFTSTSTSLISATRFSAYSTPGFRNILYEMEISGPYMRAKVIAKILKFEALQEKKVILLPGIQFKITKISLVRIAGMDNVLKVTLRAKVYPEEKFYWYKDILKTITLINS